MLFRRYKSIYLSTSLSIKKVVNISNRYIIIADLIKKNILTGIIIPFQPANGYFLSPYLTRYRPDQLFNNLNLYETVFTAIACARQMSGKK